jgi:hypothetical protein
MRSTARWYTLTMLLVGAIAAVAVLWCHLSHLKRYQGPMLFSLTNHHGVHVFDLLVLAAEASLLLALTATLLGARPERRRTHGR